MINLANNSTEENPFFGLPKEKSNMFKSAVDSNQNLFKMSSSKNTTVSNITGKGTMIGSSNFPNSQKSDGLSLFRIGQNQNESKKKMFFGNPSKGSTSTISPFGFSSSNPISNNPSKVTKPNFLMSNPLPSLEQNAQKSNLFSNFNTKAPAPKVGLGQAKQGFNNNFSRNGDNFFNKNNADVTKPDNFKRANNNFESQMAPKNLSMKIPNQKEGNIDSQKMSSNLGQISKLTGPKEALKEQSESQNLIHSPLLMNLTDPQSQNQQQAPSQLEPAANVETKIKMIEEATEQHLKMIKQAAEDERKKKEAEAEEEEELIRFELEREKTRVFHEWKSTTMQVSQNLKCIESKINENDSELSQNLNLMEMIGVAIEDASREYSTLAATLDNLIEQQNEASDRFDKLGKDVDEYLGESDVPGNGDQSDRVFVEVREINESLGELEDEMAEMDFVLQDSRKDVVSGGVTNFFSALGQIESQLVSLEFELNSDASAF